MILNSLLPAASTYAGDIDLLFDVITLLVGIPFLIASFLFFSFILRFKKKAGTPAMYITGTEHKYMKWIHRAHIPILTFDVIIVVMAVNVWYDVKQNLPEAPMQPIQSDRAAMGMDLYVHPGPDNVLDTADDIRDDQRTSHLDGFALSLQARDLSTCCTISRSPLFRLKQDAIPGRV